MEAICWLFVSTKNSISARSLEIDFHNQMQKNMRRDVLLLNSSFFLSNFLFVKHKHKMHPISSPINKQK